ncbi:ABC transporter permease [Carboxydothermus hydrogenoformans]|uniref:Oligopeptide ABC transporter, permease protein n=1 Tax=Carboxydothermus hydrogenoformans (strain ATCC BAA-161 / DSM 6008 / Z-2901) TaxID=246194 RepID=Q3A9M4_CARHZ|nr:ABC transporter permease [Carboxydothermus hydrogenoformans]ABB15201.1 oligopeptide ABC transporter, permease protein [Carboxydothermus hydrogenoformans Z-2901]
MDITKEMVEKIRTEEKNAEAITRPKTTYWQDVVRSFRKNKLAVLGLTIIMLLIIMAIIGPSISGHTYYEQSVIDANQPPNSNYYFGTDYLGRDLFTRIWYGARISLTIGVITTIICFVIGVLYGGISGYFGGKLDEVMMRIVEILSSIPFLLYVILLMVVLGPGLKTIFVALGAVYWLNMARIVRGQVLSLKEQEFVLAAKVLGASPLRILVRHIIPNTMGPIIVAMTLMIPEAIFTEAWLSFLGLGVSAPMASWGSLASEGLESIQVYPWQLFFPAFFISITMLAFNFVGDGLRDALDPRARR